MSSTLQPEQNNSQFSITGYGDGFVEINKEKWQESCIVSTSSNPISWEPTCMNEVNETNLSIIKYLIDIHVNKKNRYRNSETNEQ